MVFLFLYICKKEKLTKILIIRLSSFGDIVLTTPVIRCLKNQMEGGVEIHYLIKKKFHEILKAHPQISKFHFVENDISEVIPGLKEENFDYIIDLHNNFRSFKVKQKLGKLSFTVNKINIKKWLMVNFKWNVLPDVHIVDRYLETVKPFGIENDGIGLDYFIPTEDEIAQAALPPAHQKGYIAFVTGGNYFTKKLPAGKIISICLKLNTPVILLGGREDAAQGENILKEYNARNLYAGREGYLFNGCGKYNINQSASIIRQSKKVITHDTGLMHIAAAFKKEIISIWGNTIPEFGMYPYYGKFPIKESRFQITDLPCRPCSKLGFPECPKGHFKCMNLQDDDEIARAAAI